MLANEVLVVPMTEKRFSGRVKWTVEETNACSTWKQTRSTDASSSSGRFKMKRPMILSADVQNEIIKPHLDRSSRTSSRLRPEYCTKAGSWSDDAKAAESSGDEDDDEEAMAAGGGGKERREAIYRKERV